MGECPLKFVGGVSVNATKGPFAIIPRLDKTTSCAMSEKSSHVGKIGPHVLAVIENATNSLFETFLVPLVDHVLKKGFPVPQIKLKPFGRNLTISLVNASLDLTTGY